MAGFNLLGKAGFFITGVEFFEGGFHPGLVEEGVLFAVDDEEGGRHGKTGDIGVIRVAVKARDDFGVADSVEDLLFELRGEQTHPANNDNGFDAVVEGGEVRRADAADTSRDVTIMS